MLNWLNYGSITVTLIDYYTRGESLYLHVNVNNNTNRSYLLTASNAHVNGFICQSMSHMEAAPGQVTGSIFLLENYDVNIPYSSMSEISDIQFSIAVIDKEAYVEASVNEPACYPTVYTPMLHFKDYSVPAKTYDNGILLYHDHGFKLVKKDIYFSNQGSPDLHLLFYLENTGSQPTHYNDISFYLNQQLLDPTFYGIFAAGSRSYFELVVTAEELNLLGVHSLADIQSLTGDFTLFHDSDGRCQCGCAITACLCDSNFDGEGIHLPLLNLLQQ